MAVTSKVKRRLALKRAIIDHHSLSYLSDTDAIEKKLDNEEAIISAATELLTKITKNDPRYYRLIKGDSNANI